jgi:hypothetical protein
MYKPSRVPLLGYLCRIVWRQAISLYLSVRKGLCIIFWELLERVFVIPFNHYKDSLLDLSSQVQSFRPNNFTHPSSRAFIPLTGFQDYQQNGYRKRSKKAWYCYYCYCYSLKKRRISIEISPPGGGCLPVYTSEEDVRRT